MQVLCAGAGLAPGTRRRPCVPGYALPDLRVQGNSASGGFSLSREVSSSAFHVRTGTDIQSSVTASKEGAHSGEKQEEKTQSRRKEEGPDRGREKAGLGVCKDI